jgi:iron complex outermembrane receptor protein
MSLKKLAAGVALTTLATLAANGALAQSTASQVSEVVVTTHKQQSTGGLAVQTQVAKDQSIVGAQFIAHQVGSANAAQLINMLPGVSYASEDPTGLLSSDLRIHGFDCAHLAFTIDGTPVNDTGNYACYPGEYLPAELTDHITVNIGGSEVDSPTASSIGGTINVVSKVPPIAPGFVGSIAGGSYNYLHGYAEVDTGEIGPWNTRSYFTFNYTDSDKYKGGGNLNRIGVDGRIYQPLRDNDFVSLSYLYVKERSYFYESSSTAQYAQFGKNIDYNTQWGVPTAVSGKADGIGGPATATAPGFEQGSDASQGFWADHPNPVDFGQIRLQSKFDLSHGFTFTFDPYFFYTLANGGGVTSLKETDPRLSGSKGNGAAGCVDLNGDGDCLDTVLIYSPSNTQTDRFGLNTSLLWDLDAHNHFQLAYTLDYGNHRQTGAYGLINQQTGYPQTFFGGFDGQGIFSADGTPIRKRDRFSIAELNQVAFNYIGRFIDDKLHVNVGVRDPYFQRKLHQYCYEYNGATEYCDSVSSSAVQGALADFNNPASKTYHTTTELNALFFGCSKPNANTAYSACTTPAASTITINPVTGQPNFTMPFNKNYNFNKILPNAGATFNFNPFNQIYVTYSQGFSAPKTDDLYTSSTLLVQPETTDTYGGGYRFQGSSVTLSANLWGSVWHNHIVTSYDPNDPTLSVDRNVGEVTFYGLDLEGGLKPIEHLNLYGSLTLQHAVLDNNYETRVTVGGQSVSVALPVKGKELVMTPDQMASVRAEYSLGPVTLGAQAKYTAQRYVTDINDAKTPGFTVVDLDAEWKLPALGDHTVIQVNAYNVLNAQYLVRTTTTANANPVPLTTTAGAGTLGGNTLFYYNSAPPTVEVALKVKF